MLTSEAQLLAAYQAAQQRPAMPMIPPTYNTSQEESAMGMTTTGISMGRAAASIAISAPFTASMIPGLSSVYSGVMDPSTVRAGLRPFAAAASPVLKLLDPFAGGMAGWRAGTTLGTRVAGAALGAAPALALGMAAYSAIDYGASNVFRGAQDYVATRQLMREMPGSGFGAVSVLGGGTPLANLSASQISTANQAIQSIGGRFGLDASGSRNVLANLSQTGMIDTSSVRAMSQSYQKALGEFRQLAKTLQVDMEQTVEIYKSLDQMGFRGMAERRGVLAKASSVSSLTGRSLSSVMDTVGAAVQAGNSMGLSSYNSASVATRAMAVSALAERAGTLPESYLNRVGGYDGYANRMIELELGMSRSLGATRMMSHMYDASGRYRSDHRIGNGINARGDSGFFNRVDPYQLERMNEEMSIAMPTLVMARVDAIQAQYGAGSTRANREQFKFLQTVGIDDPQEQLAYLASARNASAGQFVQGLQTSRDRMNAAPSAAAEALQRESVTLSQAFGMITNNLTQELRRFGENMQRASEDAVDRIQTSRRGRAFGAPNYQASTGDMSIVSEFIRQGRMDPFRSNPLDDVQALEGRHRSAIARGLSSSLAFTGLRRSEGDMLLTNRLDRTIARYGYDVPESIARGLDYVRSRALRQALGFSSGNSPSRIMGGLGESGVADATDSAAYRTERGYVSFGEIMQSVANDNGQYYDIRTNSIMRPTDRGFRNFQALYGDTMASAATSLRGNVAGAMTSNMYSDRAMFGAGLLGSIAVGAGAGTMVGPGLGTVVGGALGGLGYLGYSALSGGLSGLVRGASSSIFGEDGINRDVLSPDMQNLLSTREFAPSARDHLAQATFGRGYGSLTQTQRMYFDHTLRNDSRFSDMSGIVAQEGPELNRYEIAQLGLNVELEGTFRNLVISSADANRARNRAAMYREAGYRLSDETGAETGSVFINPSTGEVYGDSASTRGGRYQSGSTTSNFWENFYERVGTKNDTALMIGQARNGMISPSVARQRLEAMAQEQEALVGDRIESDILDNPAMAAQNSTFFTGALGAASYLSSADTQQSALDRALTDYRQIAEAPSYIRNLFNGGDRQAYIDRVNQSERSTSIGLIASSIAGAGGDARAAIEQSLRRQGMSERDASNLARRIDGEYRMSTSGVSEHAAGFVSDLGQFLGRSDIASEMRDAYVASSELQAASAYNSYAAAYENVSSQNLQVVRQRYGGEALRNISGIEGLDAVSDLIRGATGSEVFERIAGSSEAQDVMRTAAGDIDRQINTLDSRPNLSPAERSQLARLRQQRETLNTYMTLGTNSTADGGGSTGVLTQMAQNLLFDADGNFNSAAITSVAGLGFTQTQGLTQIGALLDEGGTRSARMQALQNIIGTGEGAQDAFARRVGLGAGASLEEIYNRATENPQSWLNNLTEDILKSSGVEVSAEADQDLSRRAQQAMIDLSESVNSALRPTASGRAMSVVPANVAETMTDMLSVLPGR